MKNLIIVLCVCLSLVALPCASLAADESKVKKAGGILSLTLIGAGAGLLVGTFIAVVSQSSSGAAIGTGLVVGAIIGAMSAILLPEVPEENSGDLPPPSEPVPVPQ